MKLQDIVFFQSEYAVHSTYLFFFDGVFCVFLPMRTVLCWSLLSCDAPGDVSKAKIKPFFNHVLLYGKIVSSITNIFTWSVLKRENGISSLAMLHNMTFTTS
jgi:hypothetical protein